MKQKNFSNVCIVVVIPGPTSFLSKEINKKLSKGRDLNQEGGELLRFLISSMVSNMRVWL